MWYLRDLRAVVSTLIVLCLLAFGGRPVELIRDGQGSKLDAAPACVAATSAGRAGTPEGQLRFSHAIASDTVDPDAPPRVLVAVTHHVPAHSAAALVRSGSSRGPPRG